MNKDLARFFDGNMNLKTQAQLLKFYNKDDRNWFMDFYNVANEEEFKEVYPYAYESYIHTKEQQEGKRNIIGEEQDGNFRRMDLDIGPVHILNTDEVEFIKWHGDSIVLGKTYIGAKTSIVMNETMDPNSAFISGYFRIEGYDDPDDKIAMQVHDPVYVKDGNTASLYENSDIYIYACQEDFAGYDIKNKNIYAIAIGCLCYKDGNYNEKILMPTFTTMACTENIDITLRAKQNCKKIVVAEPKGKMIDVNGKQRMVSRIAYAYDGYRQGNDVDQYYTVPLSYDEIPIHLNVNGDITMNEKNIRFVRISKAKLSNRKGYSVKAEWSNEKQKKYVSAKGDCQFHFQFCKQDNIKEHENYDWNVRASKSDLLKDYIPVTEDFKENGRTVLSIQFQFSDGHKPFYVDLTTDDSTDRKESAYNISENDNRCWLPIIDFVWGCFSKDTKILMADGSEKNVQDVVKGDLIMTEDGDSAPVTSVITGEDTHMYKVETEDEFIIITHDHPLATTRGIVPACELTIGDQVKMRDGKIKDVKYAYSYPGKFPIYHIDVLNHKLFYANDFLSGDIERQSSIVKSRTKNRILSTNEKGLINDLKRIAKKLK